MSSVNDFVIEDGVLKRYTGSDADVVIPEGVTSIGKSAFEDCESLKSIIIPDSITSIGRSAFEKCKSLKSITIPDSVTNIGDWTFAHCESLKSITIPDSVTNIGDWTFAHCESLTSITIPDSVISIGNSAFTDCYSLESISIPNSVTSIGGWVFCNCTRLKSINVNDNNANYASVDGILLNKDKTVLVAYPSGKLNESFIIPDSVTSIGRSAFSSCTGLTSVTIPNSVTSIGSSAFSNCSGLISVTISNSVTSIGDYAFYHCTSLTSVTIPNSVTSIGDYAFYYTAWYDDQPDGVVYVGKVAYKYKGTCPETVTLKDGTLAIAHNAFYDCSSLENITIPDSVTSIGESAFEDCTNLESITIPNSVTRIEYKALKGTSNLKDIYYKGSKTEWNKISAEDDSFESNVTIHYNSSSSDDGILLKIEEEVRKLLSEGKSEKEVYSTLKSRNISTNVILEAFSKVKPDSEIVSSFCDKIIVPNILSIFKKEKGISKYTVGEVADILYKKYPRVLVNEAIISVLREQHLVD